MLLLFLRPRPEPTVPCFVTKEGKYFDTVFAAEGGLQVQPLSALQIGVDAHNTPKKLNTHKQAQAQANKDRHRHTQLTHISIWNKQEVLVE